MSSSIEWIKQLNELARQKLDASYEEVSARYEDALKVAKECEAQFKIIENQKTNLDQVEKLHIDLIEGQVKPFMGGVFIANPPDDFKNSNQDRKRRARLGPQRYLIFSALSTFGNSTEESICMLTDLPGKRVREQIKSDISEGLIAAITVSENDGGGFFYGLTAEGADLLSRFEAYKASRGEELPTLADVNEHQPEDDVQLEALDEPTASPKSANKAHADLDDIL